MRVSFSLLAHYYRPLPTNRYQLRKTTIDYYWLLLTIANYNQLSLTTTDFYQLLPKTTIDYYWLSQTITNYHWSLSTSTNYDQLHTRKLVADSMKMERTADCGFSGRLDDNSNHVHARRMSPWPSFSGIQLSKWPLSMTAWSRNVTL